MFYNGKDGQGFEKVAPFFSSVSALPGEITQKKNHYG